MAQSGPLRLPLRYDGAGGIAVASEPKEVRSFDGEDYLLARAITCHFALVHARIGDRLQEATTEIWIYFGISQRFAPPLELADSKTCSAGRQRGLRKPDLNQTSPGGIVARFRTEARLVEQLRWRYLVRVQ
jgi:hypothetical protein